MGRKEKELEVKELSETMQSNTGIVLTEYQGLTVAELNDLRAKLRPLKCEYKVVKNTLSRIALKSAGIDGFEQFFDGPTAIVVERGDPVAPAKVLLDFSKEHIKLKLKAGLLGKKVISANEVKALAALPPRNMLLSILLGTMNAPIQNFVNVLQATPRGFVQVLDGIRKQKEGK